MGIGKPQSYGPTGRGPDWATVLAWVLVGAAFVVVWVVPRCS